MPDFILSRAVSDDLLHLRRKTRGRRINDS